MNLLLFTRDEVVQGKAEVHGRRARHLLDVLRVKPGDLLRAGIVDGPVGKATVEEVFSDRVMLSCTFDGKEAGKPKVDLILALPRPKVLRRMWAPLASLGVGHIALTNAWRVERNYFDTHLFRPEVYEPLLKQGLEQAGHTCLPRVSVHKRLVALMEDDLEDLFSPGVRLMAHPNTDGRISNSLHGADADGVLLAVGPEGGWIDREVALFERVGFSPVSVGSSILRSDIASYVLLGLINELLQA